MDHVLLSVALKDPILISGGRLDTLRPRTVQTLVERLSQNDLRKLTWERNSYFSLKEKERG